MTDLVIPGLESPSLIGRGGFAVVYKANQPAFRRTVAVKVLSARMGDVAKARFEREVQAMGALSTHPNIVTIYDAGIGDDGRPYLIMAYLERGSLQDQIDQTGSIGWQEACDIGIKISGALEAAHRSGVLHRDVKPSNILVSQYGEPMLADFGIARLEGAMETRSGEITASLAHAPPEVVEGKAPSPASDIWSLGSTVWNLIGGRPPFVGAEDESVVPLLNSIVSAPTPSLEAIGVPESVDRAISSSLEKRMSDRPATAIAFGVALQSALTETGVKAASIATETSHYAVAEDDVKLPTAASEDEDAEGSEPDEPAPPDSKRVEPRSPVRRRTAWWLVVGALGVTLLASAAVLLTRSEGSTTTTSARTGIVGIPLDPADETAEPVLIALINDEATSSDLRIGAQAAVAYLNDHEGGLQGRPLELSTCDSTTEGAVRCAFEALGRGAIAVVPGFVASDRQSMFEELDMSEAAVVGALPLTADDLVTSASFPVGGNASALSGLVRFAGEALGIRTLAVFDGDPAMVDDVAVPVAESLDMTLVRRAITGSEEIADAASELAGSGAQAVLVVVPGSLCADVLEAVSGENFQGIVLAIEACIDPAVLNDAGESAEGLIASLQFYPLPLRTQAPSDRWDELDIFGRAMERYAPGSIPGGLNAFGFASVINLHRIMNEIGADLTPEAIVATIRNGTRRDSFMATSYQCPLASSLPALCGGPVIIANVVEGNLQLTGEQVNGVELID